MSEYIKREDAIKRLCDFSQEGTVPMPYEIWENVLSSVPSADVVEMGVWHKFGKDYVLECKTDEYGYNAFRIIRPTDEDTFMRIFKDGGDNE